MGWGTPALETPVVTRPLGCSPPPELLTRLSVTGRPPRIKYKQPLFLNYDQVRLTVDQTIADA